MARFWQHYDIDDPRTVKTFSQLVGDTETLRYLYVLTFCDARGTKLDLWNSYKDTLHTQLFHACCRLLDDEHTKDPQVYMISKESIMEQVPNLSADEVEAHYNLLPERYFIYSSPEEIALHLRMVNRLLQTIAAADSLSLLVPVIEWQDDINLGMSVVHIVTWDRAGLFYKLAGAFSVAGLSIVSSKALTRSDHITIDTFYITEPNGGVVKDPKARQLFQRSVEDALLRNKDLMPEIIEQARKFKTPSWLKKEDQLKAPLPPSVDVYHELSLRRTIIEVQATDSIGLLYKLTKAIFDNGFDITFARISTERNVAVDTFYIEPINQKQNDDTSRLLSLRQALNSIVEEIYRESY
ncbi:MAG: hypothetical protein LR015_12230 [Verrucomicrobia bacterium]|nr:hypothetical protein [Verrucomicrobiota bacterium]